MARIICQVVPRADRLTFIWSDEVASFAPYHLAGSEQASFDAIAAQAHQALAESRDASELAGVGHRLYRALFRLDSGDGAGAQQISRWLHELLAQGQVESLEFLGDRPGRVPWNMLIDRAPAPDPGVWDAFWGAKYNLAAGRRTNPLRTVAPIIAPVTLLAADTAFLGEVTGTARSRLEAWSGERLIIDVADQLANQLRRRTPDVLVLAAYVEGDALRIGSERVTPAQLQGWIAEADEGNPNPVIFLAAAPSPLPLSPAGERGMRATPTPLPAGERGRGATPTPLPVGERGRGEGAGTAEHAATWENWLTAAGASLDGLVSNIVPLPPEQAILAALAAAERFVQNRRPLGAAAADVRADLGAVGAALTVFCPPAVHVIESADAEAPAALPAQLLPDFPYCPLRPYSPDERPLFFGREEEMLRLAALVDDERTAGVILHGSAAAGKTSLIQAGLWPYLEQESVGYRILCDRMPEEEPVPEDDHPPLSVRPGRDLAGQIAEALLAFCAQPLTYPTPAGATVTVDLPEILRQHMGMPPSTAIQEAQPPAASSEQADTGIAEPGRAPSESEEPGPQARELWLALREDPARLGRLLDDVTRQLPYDLVMTIDDGEELVTLVETATERERRRLALDMLLALAESPARCKVLLVLRTEYFGRLAGLLPARSGRALWQEFFLGALSQAGMMDAVLGPTSREPILYADEIPHEKYGFAYEDGLAQHIVHEVVTEAPIQQCSAPALLQVVCAMLYEQRVRRQRQSLLRAADLRQIGGARGALARYVQEQVNRLPLPGGTRGRLRELMRRMVTHHSDGRVTRNLVAARELKSTWKDTTPIEQAVNTAAEMSGLVTIEQLLVAGQPGLYVSLGSDAVAQASREAIAAPAEAGSKRSGVIDTLWIMVPLALLACVLTWYFTRQSVTAEGNEKFDAEAKKIQQFFLRREIEKAYGAQMPLYRGQLTGAEQALDAGNALAARQILLSAPALSAEAQLPALRGFEWDYLWNRVHPERHHFEGHLGTVHALAVSADGQLAASAADDGTVRLWNIAKGHAAALIEVANTPLHAVALTPDGKTVVAAGADKKIHLFDIGAPKEEFITITKEKQALVGHSGEVRALAFAKDGKTLASGSADQTIILWDVPAGKPRAALKQHVTPVQALAFSPDGKVLATGAAEPMVILWNVEAGTKATTLATNYLSVGALAFAPDGKTLAVGGTTQQASVQAGTLRFWDIKADLATSAVHPGTAFHGQDVLALAYLPGGKLVASAGKDTLIRLWENVSAEARGNRLGHLGWIAALAATRDGLVISGSYDRTVKAFDMGASRAAQVLRGHKDWVQAVAFAGRAEHVLVSGGKDGLVKLWDPMTGAAVGELSGHKGAVTSIAVSLVNPDQVAVGTWDSKGGGEIKLWELVRAKEGPGFTGKSLHTIKAAGGIISLDFSPDPRGRLAAAIADKTVVICDTAKGEALRTLGGKQEGQVRALSFLHGLMLFTGGTDKMIRIWDAEAGKLLLGPYAAHTDAIEAIQYVRLGSEARDAGPYGCISGGLDHLVRVTAIEKNAFAARGTTTATNHPITCLLARPGLLLTGGWDGTARLWRVEAQGAKGEPRQLGYRERFTFTGHVGPVRAVAMSLVQPIIATAGDDGTIRLWRGALSRPTAAPTAKTKKAK